MTAAKSVGPALRLARCDDDPGCVSTRTAGEQAVFTHVGSIRFSHGLMHVRRAKKGMPTAHEVGGRELRARCAHLSVTTTRVASCS